MTSRSSLTTEHEEDSYSFVSFQSIEPLRLSWTPNRVVRQSQQGISPIATAKEEVIAQSDEKCGPESSKVNELQHDDHPYNWPWKIKGSMIITITLMNLITPLSTAMISPCLPQIALEFHSTNTTLVTLSVSIGLLGLAFGAVFICPLSENIGRLPIIHLANVAFVAFTIACAVSTNLAMFTGFRFLQGLAASVPPTLGGPTIADMIPINRRGPWISSWAVGPLLGPVFGPVCGGYIAQSIGWRWIFWILAMVAGVLALWSLLIMRESYSPVLTSRKANKPGTDVLNPRRIQFKVEGDRANESTTTRLLLTASLRPLKLLCLSPIVLLLSTYVAVNYGYLYLLFTSLSTIFVEEYHFSEGNVGLAFLGLGTGMIFGLGFCSWGTRVVIGRETAAGKQYDPEKRLKLMIPGAICTPIGLFWYGWSIQSRCHFMVPIAGTVVLGFGLISSFLPVISYLVDVFEIYSASAVAANTILRSIAGAFLPLIGPKMFSSLGQGWGASTLAFVSLVLLPVPVLFVKFGGRLRTRFAVQLR